jgi:GTP cyclohydrolase IA
MIKNEEERMKIIKNAVYTIMKEGLELDMNDASLKDTPNRVAKMYVNEIFSGLDNKNEPKFTTFPNDYEYNQIVVLKNISVYSTCEHHLIPFSMRISVGYIPGERVVGISKLARVAKYFASKPQVQERLSKEIADYLEKELRPEGVIVYIDKGEHLCMKMRGVENHTSEMVTSEVRGKFLIKPELEEKFLEMIK